MKTIVAYVTDLFFESKLSQTAQAVGAKMKVVSNLYKFLPELQASPTLVVIDLNAEGISASSLIAQVKQKNPSLPLLVYGDDEQEELIEQARHAGADWVLPRSKFAENLAKVLSELEAKAE